MGNGGEVFIALLLFVSVHSSAALTTGKLAFSYGTTKIIENSAANVRTVLLVPFFHRFGLRAAVWGLVILRVFSTTHPFPGSYMRIDNYTGTCNGCISVVLLERVCVQRREVDIDAFDSAV